MSGTTPDTTRGAVSLTGVTAAQDRHQAVYDANQDVGSVAAKLAASMVRRMCNQHGCEMPLKGTCDHPNHRRDVDYLRSMLDLLGLPQDFEEVTQADRDNLLLSLAQQTIDDLPPAFNKPPDDED